MRVILTGTGIPRPFPNRAGAGVLLIGTDGSALQIDCGRATTFRLAQLGIWPSQVDAVALTHFHFDHCTDLADLLLTRWVVEPNAANPLRVLAPVGPGPRMVEGLMSAYAGDIEMRAQHVNATSRPEIHLEEFLPADHPTKVGEVGSLLVESVRVDHGPVDPAVGYRVTDGTRTVAISGDTTACAAMIELAQGVDVLIHEALLPAEYLTGWDDTTRAHRLAAYHCTVAEVASVARAAGVPKLVLTHLLPPPADVVGELAFRAAVKDAGYEGHIAIGRDLLEV